MMTLFLTLAILSADLSPKADALMSPIVRVRRGCVTVGSGTAMHWDGERTFIVTNAHVLLDEPHILVDVFSYRDGGRDVRFCLEVAEVLVRDHRSDVAVLAIRRYVPPASMLSLDDRLELLEDVWQAGCPRSRDPIVSRGEVTDLAEGGGFFVISAHTWYGNSGGALFVRRGDLYLWSGIPSQVLTAKGHGPLPWFCRVTTRQRVFDVLCAHDLGYILGY